EPILRQDFADAAETPTEIVVQFVAGDRGGSQANLLKIPDEMKVLQDSLKAGVNAGFFKHPQPILGATAHDLGKAYLNQPAVLYVAGHGNDRSLSLIAHQGPMVTTQPLTGDQLVQILTNFPSRLLLCVLNACESREIAEHLANSAAVDVAIGWSGKPSDVSAITFVKHFYEHLSHGLTVRQAFNLAQATLGIVSASVSPILFARTGIDLPTFRLLRGSKE
ncbi:MAG: CHAT domain-containing protein, partial [Acidobacteriales bacterium]|nr:CHAT domain-containing protein [Terriglobales bacterium]